MGISSSEEEDRINAQKSHGQSQETIFVKHGQQFIGLKPNQAVDLMIETTDEDQCGRSRKTVSKQKGGLGHLTNRHDVVNPKQTSNQSRMEASSRYKYNE